MPILHRLACFRDDVVFLVFLYQVRVCTRLVPSFRRPLCQIHIGWDTSDLHVSVLSLLLQRWIYRIDPKRVNEYGQVMASDADAVAEKEVDKKDPESKKNK